MIPTALRRFAWSTVAFNVAVVAWGAFVRATGSGAGCGRHWPTCKGELVPRAPALETAVEFTHRATSGIALLLVVALVIWMRRALPRGHAARRAAVAALALMIVEALLGAALVRYGWVARDASPERGWVMAVHLTNTLLLLGALTLAASWVGAPAAPLARRSGVTGALLLGAGAMVIAGASGAIAALGDTLYPPSTLGEALRQDLDASARLLLRLRLLHPPLAVIAAAAVAFGARLAAREVPEAAVRRGAAAAAALALAQLALGSLNLLLLAPVGLQLAHLALADLTWIAFAALAARALAPGAG